MTDAPPAPPGALAPGAAALVASRWREVRARVDAAAARAGRAPGSVTLVAVSKTHPPGAVSAAYAAGARDFGENYAQDLHDKAAALAGSHTGLRWHFIGHLQRNKAKLVVGVAAVLQTLDSDRLLEAVAARVAPGAVQDVLVEVNVGGESQKGGVAPDGLVALIERARAEPRVRVLGLMAIPPASDDPERTRPYFARLRTLRDEAAARTGAALAELSMGMSSDFEAAVEEGSTCVRVGTAIFGQREARA